jgi:hypothetical protein
MHPSRCVAFALVNWPLAISGFVRKRRESDKERSRPSFTQIAQPPTPATCENEQQHPRPCRTVVHRQTMSPMDRGVQCAGQTDAISAGWPKVGWDGDGLLRDCEILMRYSSTGRYRRSTKKLHAKAITCQRVAPRLCSQRPPSPSQYDVNAWGERANGETSCEACRGRYLTTSHIEAIAKALGVVRADTSCG